MSAAAASQLSCLIGISHGVPFRCWRGRASQPAHPKVGHWFLSPRLNMALQEYKAKRDFRQTSEPSGRTPVGRKDEQPAFVIQKHAASHLHYDFRLEMAGVLKSWAVPKGFPVKRGDRRLAVEVEDHPLEYGGFEGTIPEGNYGAGTVMLWDRGTYTVSGENALEALRSGKIHFWLKGKKLKGEWTLVRMRHFEGAKPQWLLLKSSSDLEPLSREAEDQSVLSKRSMDQIAGSARSRQWTSNRVESDAKKVLPRSRSVRATRQAVDTARPRSRVGRAVLNAPRPAKDRPAYLEGKQARNPTAESQDRRQSRRAARLNEPSWSNPGIDLSRLPARQVEFAEPMKALLVGDLPHGAQWVYEIKFDGVRALALKKGKSVELISRSGKDLGQKYHSVIEALAALPADQVILDGEVVAVDSQGRSAFQLLQSYQSAGRSRPPLFYYVFDVLQLEGKDLAGLPLWQRKAVLEKVIADLGSTVRFSGNIQADSERLMREMRARGLEGLIAKRKESRYESGRRSGAWVKFKWTNEQEFVIGGYTRPQGARSNFGAILVGYYENDRLLFAAKVGTGFNEQTLKKLFGKFQKLVQPDCPFANLPEKFPGLSSGLGPAEMRRCTWLRPELVCQVRFAEWTRDNHLRQPAFLGLREDKSAREVVRERPRPVH